MRIRSTWPVQGRGRRASILSSLSSGSISRKRGDLAIAAATRSAGALAEALESRLLMAAHTWLGPVNLLWSDPGNWIGGAPGANEAHVALVFPATGIQKSLIDDIPTLNQVDSITFTGTGYNIDGSSSTIHLNALGATYNIDDQAGQHAGQQRPDHRDGAAGIRPRQRGSAEPQRAARQRRGERRIAAEVGRRHPPARRN